MKKLLALVLVIALAATVFACTPSEDTTDTSPTPENIETPDATPTDDVDDVDDTDDSDDTAAEPAPSEIADAGAMELGVWPLAEGMYDPALDAESIPAGAYMYGFFDAAYMNIDMPAAIAGYELVGTAAELAPGKFAALVVNSFNYVAIMPVSGAFEPLPVAELPVVDTSDMPAEIAAAGAMDLGVWPLAAGTYDPGLDAESIPAGAKVYGFFGGDYTNIDFPAAIDGFEQVDAAADVTTGTFAPIVVNGFNYVVIMP